MSKPPKLSMAHLPTPIEEFSRLRPGLWVKRDDFSGCELSGNKVRKLEYLVAEATEQQADTLITAGDVQSNHARATAVVASRLGLRSLLVLEGPAQPDDWTIGNMFLDRLVGAEIDWEPEEGNIAARLEAAAQRIRSRGRRPFVIPVGGSNELGLWGYIDAAREAMEQCQAARLRIDRLVCPAGSCGTLAGLLLGVRLAEWPVQVTGIGISSTAEKKRVFARALAERAIQQYKLPLTLAAGEPEIYHYAGMGYAKSCPEELACIIDAARRGGLVLDPVYTGKAFFGLMDMCRRGLVRDRENVLFFHTGGLLGLLAKARHFDLQPIVSEMTPRRDT